MNADRRRVFLYVAGAVAGAVVAASAASVWLRPLGALLPATREMVLTSREILAETQTLQSGAGQVRANLMQVQRQEQMLEEQIALTEQVLSELHQQGELGTQTRERLSKLLATEQVTVDLTRQADQASAGTMGSVYANAKELEGMLAQGSRIAAGSRAVDLRLGALLTEMEGSAENFALLGRLKTAAATVGDRTSAWWNRLWEWWR